MIKKILWILLFNFFFQSIYSQSQITENEIRDHILFLTSEKVQGRFPGGKENNEVVKYIKKEFKKIGVKSFKNSYQQEFDALLKVEKGSIAPLVKTCNVLGYIEGSDPLLKNEYIILGAHYDHLGLGGPSSKSKKRGVAYFGADDNASGVAALLEIAEKIAHTEDKLKRSILFIAFGAEEQGLLGSRYFVENPIVPLSQIKLMINMDMIGRLNKKKEVYMGGAGTFLGGVKLMTDLGKSLGLNPVVHAGSVGGSDHVSFYKKNISVLGIHTGGHPQYHTPEDTIEFINLKGEKQICEYIFQTIVTVAAFPKMNFIKQD